MVEVKIHSWWPFKNVIIIVMITNIVNASPSNRATLAAPPTPKGMPLLQP